MIVRVKFDNKEEIEKLNKSNTFFHDFDKKYKYIVLSCQEPGYFTIFTGKKRQKSSAYKPPCIYPEEMFEILDESIPEDWVLRFYKDKKNVYSVKDFKIHSYSDVKFIEAKEAKSISLFPSKFDRFIFIDYIDGKKEAIESLEPYLDNILQLQLKLNR